MLVWNVWLPGGLGSCSKKRTGGLGQNELTVTLLMLSIFLIVLFQLKVTLVVNGSQAPATSKEKQSSHLSWTDRSVTIAAHGKVTVYG